MRNLLICSTLVILGNIGSVSADESTNDISRYFIQGDIGVAMHVFGIDGFEDEKGNGTAFSLAAGYNFTENVSASFGFVEYGSAKVMDIYDPDIGTIDFYSISNALTAQVKIISGYEGDEWRFYADLGIAKNNYVLEGETTQLSIDIIDKSKVSFLGGVGAAYTINDNLQLLLEGSWNVYQVDGQDLDVNNVDVQISKYSIGLKYNF